MGKRGEGGASARTIYPSPDVDQIVDQIKINILFYFPLESYF
jgi:hypothetical protein